MVAVAELIEFIEIAKGGFSAANKTKSRRILPQGGRAAETGDAAVRREARRNGRGHARASPQTRDEDADLSFHDSYKPLRLRKHFSLRPIAPQGFHKVSSLGR